MGIRCNVRECPERYCDLRDDAMRCAVYRLTLPEVKARISSNDSRNKRRAQRADRKNPIPNAAYREAVEDEAQHLPDWYAKKYVESRERAIL